MVVMLFGSGVVNAQTVSRIELEQQYKALLIQVIELLMKQVAELQTQLVVLQAQQAQQQIVSPVQKQPITGGEITATSTEATSTPSVSTAAPKQYSPAIKLEVVGTKVIWQASGEKFNCKLNGEAVWQEGSKETGGVITFTLVCVGNETGTKLEKSV